MVDQYDEKRSNSIDGGSSHLQNPASTTQGLLPVNDAGFLTVQDEAMSSVEDFHEKMEPSSRVSKKASTNSFNRSSRNLQITTDITLLAQQIAAAAANTNTNAARSPSIEPATPKEFSFKLSTPRSTPSLLSLSAGLAKSVSNIPSLLTGRQAGAGVGAEAKPETFQDYLDQSNPELNPFSPQFSPHAWAKQLLTARAENPERYPSKAAGIAFRNLGAVGRTKKTDYQKTVLNAVYQLKDLVSGGKNGERKRQILRNFNGVTKKGETCVVLGRPGR